MRYALLTLLSHCLTSAHAQTQLGDAIPPQGNSGWWGWDVSISQDGGRVAISDPLHIGPDEEIGLVRVFDYSGGNWIQVGNDLTDDWPTYSFGEKIALSGDGSRLAVRSHYSLGLPPAGGAVHVQVYAYQGGTWTPIGTALNGSTDQNPSNRSMALALDGERLALGIPVDADGTHSGVRVLEFNGSDWTQLGDTLVSTMPMDLFGASISFSADGNVIAVGAPGILEDGELGEGYVQVYGLVGDTWLELGNAIEGTGANVRYGFTTSLSNTGVRLALSSHSMDWDLAEGHVRILEFEDGDWMQLGETLVSANDSDRFGYAISLSGNGDRIAVTAPWADAIGDRSGEALLFELMDGSWQQRGNAVPGTASEQFGWSVGLSNDGYRMVVGAASTISSGIRVYEFLDDVGSEDISTGGMVTIHGNPTSGLLTVDLGSTYPYVRARIRNSVGKLVQEVGVHSSNRFDLILEEAPGIYLIELSDGNARIAVAKVVKQ